MEKPALVLLSKLAIGFCFYLDIYEIYDRTTQILL